MVIAFSKVGTYPIQGIIELIKTSSERQFFIENFKDSILNMCKDLYASHIVEKMISCFSETSIHFIYELIVKNFLYLANDSNGLCVVKKIIIHTSDKEIFKQMKDILTENTLSLVINPYGNYAVQTALEYWKDEDITPIIMKFSDKYINLSMHKYSSNVVEKCIEKNEQFGFLKFIEEITTMNRIVDLMKNNYGNYVVQKALKLASNPHKLEILQLISQNIDMVGEKKLINKWRSIVNSFAKSFNVDVLTKSHC